MPQILHCRWLLRQTTLVLFSTVGHVIISFISLVALKLDLAYANDDTMSDSNDGVTLE